MRYKENNNSPEIVKVYEKIKDGIWVYNGYFHLIDAWQEKLDRTVFKFRLEMIDSDIEEEKLHDTTELELEHNRLIPIMTTLFPFLKVVHLKIQTTSNYYVKNAI